MSAYVLDLADIDGKMLPLVGGKAASLGELSKIPDIHVPNGFCVTTEAYKAVMQNCEEFNSLLRLLRPYNSDWIGEVCERIRNSIESAAIPMSVRDDIINYLGRHGAKEAEAYEAKKAGAHEARGAGANEAQDVETYKSNETGSHETLDGNAHETQGGDAHETLDSDAHEAQDGDAREADETLSQNSKPFIYAVRSSATAEDMPTDSFAGQHDTFLNISGADAVLKHISMCWASLYTERAVAYRIERGIDHSSASMAVVVQKMVFPEVSGIMFTADPATSNRKITSIDAGFGMGEAYVSGYLAADNYSVRGGAITGKRLAPKERALYAAEGGAIEERPVDASRRDAQALDDAQILNLEKTGRAIEAYYGKPQDIEWCYSEGGLHIVQSRPITTLYPLPDKQNDEGHVYISFGHQSMMTDAMKPLGISFFQMVEPTLVEAGGRLFIDLAHDLASPVGRVLIKKAIGKIDPLMAPAVTGAMERADFMKTLERGKRFLSMGSAFFTWELPLQVLKITRKNDPAIVRDLMARGDTFLRRFQVEAEALSGADLLEFIKTDHKRMQKELYSARGMGTVYAGALALGWINKKMEKWLGEKSVGDVLSQSVDNNTTGKLGLELLDVADVARECPEVVEYLQSAGDEAFFDGMKKLNGGGEAAAAIEAYLEKYGMRCAGEIDITRSRWAESPSTLAPMILGNIKNFGPGASAAVYDKCRKEAEQKTQDVLERLSKRPFGKGKTRRAGKKINVLRNYIGYREYPKHFMMQYYWLIKQALLREADRLVQGGALRNRDDIFYLRFDELHGAVRTGSADYGLIERRMGEHIVNEKLTPPRVMTSEGEVLRGEYSNGKLPPGALPGIAVSPGVAEGRARVVMKLEDARLEEGDILVTAYTDPSWTPLFVSVSGLVAEVGGAMTHGSVVAREYGLPAVAGVEGATKLIRDGQMIRVNGTDGYVELMQ